MVTVPSAGSVRLTQTMMLSPSSILVNTPGEDIKAANKWANDSHNKWAYGKKFESQPCQFVV